MGQIEAIHRGATVRDRFTYAWKGTRYCDLQMSEANLKLIQEDLADGYNRDDYIAITVHLVDRKSRCIVRSHDLGLEIPYPKSLAKGRAELWYEATMDEMEKEQQPALIEIEVEVKEKPE